MAVEAQAGTKGQPPASPARPGLPRADLTLPRSPGHSFNVGKIGHDLLDSQKQGTDVEGEIKGSGVYNLPTYRHCRNVEPNGLTGDLKTSVERQWDAVGETWSAGDTTYFRYYLGAAGNMISAPKTGDETTRIHYVFDAWNRLAAVYADDSQNPGQPGDLIAAYEYDGANRRVEKTLADETAVDYFYNRQWQMLEQRTNDGETTVVDQYVWSPRYIDAPILRDTLSTAGTDILQAERVLYLADANYNVTGLLKYDSQASDWTVAERYTYTPYGEGTYRESDWDTAGSSANANTTLYTGRTLDLLTSLYYYRARHYDAALERFVSRDPIGYWGGINLYEYVGDSPLNRTDPRGLGCLVTFKCTLTNQEDVMILTDPRKKPEKVGVDCFYKYTDTSRKTVASAVGTQDSIPIDCDALRDIPAGQFIIYQSKRAKNTAGFWQEPYYKCDDEFEDAKMYTVKGDVPTKSDCSQSECRKMCDGGGAAVDKFCDMLKDPARKAICKSLGKVGGVVCHDFCNAICLRP